MFAVLAAARFAHFAALTLLFGLAAFPLYAPRATPAIPALRRLLRALAALALATGGGELLVMAGNMGGGPASMLDPAILSAVMTDTDYGKVWAGRLVLAAVVLGLSLRCARDRDWAMLAGSGLLLASVGLTGHSAMPGGWLGLGHQAADALHLLAAGWWIGGLLALALTARALGAQAVPLLQRFSGIGYAAVATLVLTGLFKSAILLVTLGETVSTAYGWVLLAKLALFAGMLALAFGNNLWITPRLARGVDPAPWLGRLRRHVALEFALGLLVLATVGALGAMSPPVSGP